MRGGERGRLGGGGVDGEGDWEEERVGDWGRQGRVRERGGWRGRVGGGGKGRVEEGSRGIVGGGEKRRVGLRESERKRRR